ncbi:MAG: DMT family transporter [Acidimicrobiia bacterium]
MATTRMLSTSHGTNRQAFSGSDWALFVGLSLIWGSSFLLIAIGLDSFDPGLVTLLRVGFGAIVLSLFPAARRRTIEPEDRNKLRMLGFVWIALPLTLFPIAQQWIDSSVAGMLNGATPIFTALLATILLRALPGRLQLVGLFAGFAGIIAIALPSAGGGRTAAIGVALVLVATVCYSIALNVVTPLTQKYGSLPVMAFVLRVGAILTIPYGLYGATQSSFSWPSMLAMLVLGIVGAGLAFYMMGLFNSSVGATRSAFITYAIPVVALVLGVVVRNELVAPVAVIGVVLVIVGAFLASRREV